MKTAKKHYCYLAGNISDNPATYEWREKFIKIVEQRPHLDKTLCILDPTSNRFNQRIKPTGKEEESLFERAQVSGFGVLPKKDYGMIKICTLIVANLIYVDPAKPMIGTCFEFDWARMLMIPIIAIVDETQHYSKLYSKHPFMNECISSRVGTVEEAVDVVDNFFVFI